MENEIHPIQAKILTKLLLNPDTRFTDLNVDGVESDHFNFHIKRLINLELIIKNEQGNYNLTPKGKEYANRFDTDKHKIERQAKIGMVIIGIKITDGKKQYLIQQRLKEPYYGFHGFVGGKVRWGETITEAGLRELYEETGMEADLSVAGVEHKMDYTESKDLLEDKFFFILKAEHCLGDMVERFEGGANFWFTKEEIEKLDDLFPDVMTILTIIEHNTLAFEEKKFTVNKY